MSVRPSLLVAALSFFVVPRLVAHEPAAPYGIAEWLKSYEAAFNSRDIERLAPFYHRDVTIFEGGSTNDGWADYRDNHLGPELKEMENLDFRHSNVSPHTLGPEGSTAYVTSEYRLKARIGGKDVDAQGLETLVLVKEGGGWKIRHSHTSSRRKPPQAALGSAPPKP